MRILLKNSLIAVYACFSITIWGKGKGKPDFNPPVYGGTSRWRPRDFLVLCHIYLTFERPFRDS